MISDYLYNTKLKIYPDQTIVATFANRPKFRTVSDDTDCSNKPGKALMSWRYEIMLKSNITYDNGYIYTDFETGELIYISHLMPADTLCLTDRPNFPKRSDNVKRAKDKIFDLVALNDWDYFFTGTLGSTKFDPTNAKEALKPVQKWLNNMVTRYGLKYVLVAEYQPKSGRIHWHGFINDALQVVDSGTRLVPWAKKPKKISTIIKNGYDPALYDDRVVYNLPQWRFGWSTAIKAYNGSQACARYITKYVTKEDKAIFGRYYWSSKNIRREPDICLTDFDYDNIFTQEYKIPRTRDSYKYYTFFGSDTSFFWENDGKSDFEKMTEYKTAADNSSAIFDIIANLDDFEEIDSFSDFDVVGG